MGRVSPSISPTWPSLADCSKTIVVRQNFTDLHVWNNGRTPRRMLKKSRLLTRPTQARRDAPCPRQGRSE